MNEVIHYDLPAPGGDGPSPAQRRQRNALIGLSVGSALVLFLGVTAVLVTRASGEEPRPVASVPASTVESATSTAAATTSASTTTTTSTTSSTIAPAEPVADAGDDLAVDAGSVVTLQASAVTAGALDRDITWRQTVGPDVTAGVGALGGRAVSFGSPDDVVTLAFELVVVVASEAEAVDSIVVRVFEDADAAVFVDGDVGDDAADGSIDAPMRTVAAGASAATDGADVYVRSGPTYAEVDTITLGVGTSLYGGFGEDWDRDVTRRVSIDGAPVAIMVSGDGDRRLSGLEVAGRDAETGGDATGVRIDDGETVTISDSRVVAGAAGAGGLDDEGETIPAGVSAGVFATDTDEVRMERSTVNAGLGGNGASGPAAADREIAGSGENASGASGGSGAETDDRRRGGDGGDGATNGAGDDGRGDGGGPGGSDPLDDGAPGRGGPAGAGGRGGDGGAGTVNGDGFVPIGNAGVSGEDGGVGGGAGGGGGGGAAGGVDGSAIGGGGGGGGGAGGSGGGAGTNGAGGGGSVGIWASGVDLIVVAESLVAAGPGGTGAAGGEGGRGGSGGDGGRGDVGSQQVANSGDGGGGGGGGSGGDGGTGGGGAGGPSVGLLTDGVDEVLVSDSTVRGASGGAGADGGRGGADGVRGGDGTGRRGGVGAGSGTGEVAERGVGASGGSSFGWFDVGRADQRLDGADFLEGTAGPGGDGSTRGADGRESASTTG